MRGLKLSILTNMVTPYRAPLFHALAANDRVDRLRVLTCIDREPDRLWEVKDDESYMVTVLPGITLNLKRGNDGRRILHFRFGIFWELIRNRPDRLVIGDASWTSYLAAFSCRLLRIPYLVWNEITTSSQISTGLTAKLRRRMFSGAYRLIASCQMAKTFLMQNGVPDEKIDIVLNAVDNDFFVAQRRRWEPQRSDLRKNLGIAEDAFCFIYVGQLISRKRVLETVELVATAATQRPVHLLVAGTGPLEGQMREKSKMYNFSAITFLGHVDPQRLSQLYVACDALILLSQDEPWGMVINEILLFGKGYFTSDAVAAAVELKSHQSHWVIKYEKINTDELLEYMSGVSYGPNNDSIKNDMRAMSQHFFEAINS